VYQKIAASALVCLAVACSSDKGKDAVSPLSSSYLKKSAEEVLADAFSDSPTKEFADIRRAVQSKLEDADKQYVERYDLADADGESVAKDEGLKSPRRSTAASLGVKIDAQKEADAESAADALAKTLSALRELDEDARSCADLGDERAHNCATAWMLLEVKRSREEAQTTAPSMDGLVIWLRADLGVTHEDGVVTGWENQGELSDTLGTEAGPQWIEDGGDRFPVLRFSGAERMTSTASVTLDDATIFARFKFTVATSDDDYVYQIGTIETGSAGSLMALARGDYSASGAHLKSYHFDGASAHYGADIESDVWTTSSQVYLGSATSASHHTLWLNGDDAMMSSSAAAYAVDGLLTVGSWGARQYGFVGDFRELLVYERRLDADEREAVEAYLAR
jgi:hypothetical protein